MLFFKTKPSVANFQSAAPTVQPRQCHEPAPHGYVPLQQERRFQKQTPVRYQQVAQQQTLQPIHRDQLGGFPKVPQHDAVMMNPNLRSLVGKKCEHCGQAYVLYQHDTLTIKGFPAVKYACPHCHKPTVFGTDRNTGEARRLYPKSEFNAER